MPTALTDVGGRVARCGWNPALIRSVLGVGASCRVATTCITWLILRFPVVRGTRILCCCAAVAMKWCIDLSIIRARGVELTCAPQRGRFWPRSRRDVSRCRVGSLQEPPVAVN